MGKLYAVPRFRRSKGVSMIDHLSVVVSDYARSKAFYLQALAPTGHSRLTELRATSTGRESAGFCHADGSDFWISQGAAIDPPIHVAFRVSSRAAVDAFYKEIGRASCRERV